MAEAQPELIDGLDVNEVKDGLVVYDPARDRVHYLNATASVVFTLCDGQHDRAAMGAVLTEAFGLDEPPIAEVDEALAQLAGEGLPRSTST
jgi:hypothetical protein